MESRNRYDTDLTDTEWNHLEPLVPAAKPGGRPVKHARREILNGIFYIVRSGSAWKLLPHDLPPWRTVYHYFWSWRRDGTWQTIHDTVRTWVRQAVGRKRHLLVDTLGLLLLVVITAANVQDREAAHTLLTPLATIPTVAGRFTGPIRTPASRRFWKHTSRHSPILRGVFRVLRFDNLKSAVKQVLRGHQREDNGAGRRATRHLGRTAGEIPRSAPMAAQGD